MRILSRPPTARCTLAIHVSFLLSEPHSPTCGRLAEVMAISHDSVNRFLLREDYTPRDLFDEVRSGLNLKGGTVSVDDAVLDKPYSQLMAFVGYFWSGKHHRVVKGINLITWYSLPNSYPYMRMNQISIFLSNSHRGILKIFDLIEESHHESEVDV